MYASVGFGVRHGGDIQCENELNGTKGAEGLRLVGAGSKIGGE